MKETELKTNSIGQVKPRSIVEEMQDSYLDYAMSVIISRALPDVRDGLKPVQRRILYAMYRMGLTSSAKFRKSATVVGEVLGKYHPHGDAAVYDALVRMAQDFSLRYPLISGQGNFGSIDGDAPSAMRYSEARLARITEEMLVDIDKATVDWADNYDGTRQEPMVLPAKLPQLLLNGSMGIAVGMATNIPPHNLGEVIEGIIYLIDHPQASIEEICQFIKGPDFPTGGAIYDQPAIVQAYGRGRGSIVMRAKTEIVEKKAGQFQIIVTQIPYAVNKANLIIKIAELIKEKRLEGIKNIIDESDKEGIRIVIDLKNDLQPQKILNRLFKLTDLQKSFHLNMLALVDGLQPRVLSLKSVLEEYIKHRQTVVSRRTRFELNQAKEREHILIGLNKALDQIDAVIETIKKSANREKAHLNLIKKFKFSHRQATAILEMRLQNLAGLERKKIKEELAELKKKIKELEALLKSPKKILDLIKKELAEIKEKYADPRRTKVYRQAVGQFREEELVPQEECVIVLTQGGYIKRINPRTYRAQKRGGKGISIIVPRQEDLVGHFLSSSTHDYILFFTDQGRVFQIRAFEIPEFSRTARGQALVNILQIGSQERVTAVVPIKERGEKNRYLLMATEQGAIKRTKIKEFAHVRRSGLIAIRLNKNDRLRWAKLTTGQNEIILVTGQGQSIRFKEKDVRPMGRTAAGVRGIRLKKGDQLVSMDVIAGQAKEALLIVTENGFGKKTALNYYKTQKRGGGGIKTAKVTSKTGLVKTAAILQPGNEELILVSGRGQAIKTKLKDIPSLGRTTQGVRIMRLNQGDQIASIAVI